MIAELTTREGAGLVPGEMGYSPKIDALEQAIAEALPEVEMPLTHQFVPGMYIREIFLKAGTIVTTKIHKTKHPFFILMGRVRVVTEDDGVLDFVGPCWGITNPGTRRAIAVIEDTIWITCHVTEETDLKKIEAAIIHPHVIPQRRALIP